VFKIVRKKLKSFWLILFLIASANLDCTPYKVYPTQVILSGKFIDTLTCSGAKIWLINFDSTYQDMPDYDYGVKRLYKGITYSRLIFSTGLQKFKLDSSKGYFISQYQFQFSSFGEADPTINLPQLTDLVQTCLPKDSINKSTVRGILFSQLTKIK